MKNDIPAVIPVAGLGTRMLPLTKIIPKELLPLPIYYKGVLKLIPILQLIFMKLYEAGIRNYYFIVSRDKEAIVKYLTPDWRYVEELKSKMNKDLESELLENFYKIISESKIKFLYQDKPSGFGPAVYLAREFIESNFIIHPGDDFIIDVKDSNYITRLIDSKEAYNADITLYVERVEDPRHYGVIKGEKIDSNIYEVFDLIEKPKDPPTNLAITAIYLMDVDVFTAMDILSRTSRAWELVDSVRYLMNNKGKKVIAVEIDNEKRIDVGRASEYLKSILKCMKSTIEV